MTYCYQCVAWRLGHCYKEGNDTAYNDTCNGANSIKELYEKEEKRSIKQFAERLKAKKHCTFGESPFEDDCKEYVLIADIDETLKELDEK